MKRWPLMAALVLGFAAIGLGQDAAWQEMQWRDFASSRFPSDWWEQRGGELAAKTVTAGAAADLMSVERFQVFEMEWEWRAGSESSAVLYGVPGDAEALWALRSRQVLGIVVPMLVLAGLLISATLWKRKFFQGRWAWVRFAVACFGVVLVAGTLTTLWRYRTSVLEHRGAYGFAFALASGAPSNGVERTGALYHFVAPQRETPGRGEWNSGRLVVRDPKVEHWVNGEKALEYQWQDVALRRAIFTAERRDLRELAALHLDRPVHVFLKHSPGVVFRNVRIRRLTK